MGTKLGHGGPVGHPSSSALKGFPIGFIEVPLKHHLWGRQRSCRWLRSVGFCDVVDVVGFFA